MPWVQKNGSVFSDGAAKVIKSKWIKRDHGQRCVILSQLSKEFFIL